MNLMVYDAEIVNAIPVKGEAREPEIGYCNGWTDYVGMEVSVICAYLWGEGYRVFCKDNFGAFNELAENPETLLVGFNNHSFDDRLIRACLGTDLDERRSWDLLEAVRVARGGSPGYIAGGPNLDKLCRANFLPGKRGDGARAPILWQQGKTGQVIDYGLNDVQQTKKLIELVLYGRLRDHESGRILSVPPPEPQFP
jgi:hypothetical protein